jgi:two-component system sensor kinase FixL
MTNIVDYSSTERADFPFYPKTLGPSYSFLFVAILSLLSAVFGIADGFRRLESANHEVQLGYRVISAAEDALSIARDAETGQQGYVLTGEDRFLEPYDSAIARAQTTWLDLGKMAVGSRQASITHLHHSFLAKQAFTTRAVQIARQKGLPSARQFVASGKGTLLMDHFRSAVDAFVREERSRLGQLQAESDWAYRNAFLQAAIASFALVLAGALLYAAFCKAQIDAALNAERALQANRRFEATFAQSTVGMILLTDAGDAIIVNDAMSRQTGYSRSEILTAPRQSPAHPMTLLIDAALGHHLPTGPEQDVEWERWTQAKDGSQICLSVLLSAVRAPEGGISFFSGFARDITAQRQAELELEESQSRSRLLQEELAHIGRVNVLGEMAAAIAHEVNQPLTAITNYMSAGQRLAGKLPDKDDGIAQIMQRAADQAQRAGQIIQRMHSFVTRQEEARSTEVLAYLIHSAIDLALLGVDKSRVSIHHEPGSVHYMVNVDPIQIQQVLLILIRNAIDAAGDQEAVHIAIRKQWEPQSGHVAIFVSDNGPGLAPAMAAQLFQPFATSKPGHMGMGLPIAKRLIEHHGGRLRFLPSPQGATFRIDLPVLGIQSPQRACPAPQMTV